MEDYGQGQPDLQYDFSKTASKKIQRTISEAFIEEPLRKCLINMQCYFMKDIVTEKVFIFKGLCFDYFSAHACMCLCVSVHWHLAEGGRGCPQ